MNKNLNTIREFESEPAGGNLKAVEAGKVAKFHDYDGFVEKFKPKKTTDDCYTPPEVYEIVLDFVRSKYDLSGLEVVRPFYPGGDFERFDYPANCAVIDNPPFSIISKICRFYLARQIPFFLFAPHLTLFSSDIDCTHVVVGGNIVYENGAQVKTSFLTNMLGDVKVLGVPELYEQFKALTKKNSVELPKYEYPPNILTVSTVSFAVEKGVPFKLMKSQVKHCRALLSQKQAGKGIFGSGFLISDSAAAEKAAAEKAAAEKAAAEKAAAEKAAAEKVNVITWELSEQEKADIELLNLLG